MEEKKYTSLIRLRMSAKDAHYGGNLVDGAHMVHPASTKQQASTTAERNSLLIFAFMIFLFRMLVLLRG